MPLILYQDDQKRREKEKKKRICLGTSPFHRILQTQRGMSHRSHVGNLGNLHHIIELRSYLLVARRRYFSGPDRPILPLHYWGRLPHLWPAAMGPDRTSRYHKTRHILTVPLCIIVDWPTWLPTVHCALTGNDLRLTEGPGHDGTTICIRRAQASKETHDRGFIRNPFNKLKTTATNSANDDF